MIYVMKPDPRRLLTSLGERLDLEPTSATFKVANLSCIHGEFAYRICTAFLATEAQETVGNFLKASQGVGLLASNSFRTVRLYMDLDSVANGCVNSSCTRPILTEAG